MSFSLHHHCQYPLTSASSQDLFDIHALGTACDLPSLFHALKLASTLRILLAFHVIVIEWSTSRSNEKGSTHQRGGSSSNLLDFGNAIRQRGEIE
jgi:hypothetical protein